MRPPIIAALVLAACAIDPASGLEEIVFFPPELVGPTCAPERQDVECGCSECLTWEVVEGVTGYEVERVTVSSGATYLYDLPLQLFVDPVTQEVTTFQQMIWCPAKGVPFPREGTLYAVRVRAYRPGPILGDPSNEVVYRAAPYACFESGDEVQCYTADPLARR